VPGPLDQHLTAAAADERRGRIELDSEHVERRSRLSGWTLDRFEAKMRIVLWVCTFAMFGAGGSMQVRSADVWEKADQAVLRLAPSAFPTLPPIIKHDLERRGCTVPQPDPATIGRSSGLSTSCARAPEGD
jgi:hypothetical protein